MPRPAAIFEWLVRDQHWAQATLPMAIVLLALGPLIATSAGVAVFYVVLQLPIYMLHQYEEHSKGAFKAAMNASLPPGAAPLTDEKILWINIVGVWLLDLVAVVLARYVRGPLGLIAAYLGVVNGLIHVAMGIRQRRYNPGLWTSLLLLLPVGGYSIVRLSRATKTSWLHHVLGLGIVVLLHLLTFRIMRGTARR